MTEETIEAATSPPLPGVSKPLGVNEDDPEEFTKDLADGDLSDEHWQHVIDSADWRHR